MILKKILLIYSLLFITLISCTNSLGKKGEWNATYKQEFVSNCKTEINKEKSLVKIDSLIVFNICSCIAEKAEKESDKNKDTDSAESTEAPAETESADATEAPNA